MQNCYPVLFSGITSLLLSLSNFESILCFGAHADDIEIGCGGTLLSMLDARPNLHLDWVVLSTGEQRSQEARESFKSWCGNKPNCKLHLHEFEDTLFPTQLRELKYLFSELAKKISPQLIFTHRREDAHQDHRTVAEITWNAFRNHLILEYEIPKYEGDLGNPNVFVPLSKEIAQCKLKLLMTEFESQQSKPWYDSSTFQSLMQLRAIECRAESGFAEAFHGRKVRLSAC